MPYHISPDWLQARKIAYNGGGRGPRDVAPTLAKQTVDKINLHEQAVTEFTELAHKHRQFPDVFFRVARQAAFHSIRANIQLGLLARRGVRVDRSPSKK